LAQRHHGEQVSLMLILPTAPHTSHRVGSWGSLISLWWGNKYHLTDRGNHPRNLSFVAKISKLRDRIQKREERVMQCQNRSILPRPKARWKATSPIGKIRLSFSCTNLFK
jgi:hypothetical protein